MKFTIPGFPEEVSEAVELPDFAELLTYPMFLRATPETVRSHGTDWQRMLLELTPFRHEHPYQSVTTGVHIQAPGYRTLVGPTLASQGPHHGWHIDGSAAGDHLTGAERVYLMESPCTSLTQFNELPIEIDVDPAVLEDRSRLIRHITENASSLGIRGRAIPPARIVTFTNHLHRAVVPRRMEFRFFWRARESHKDAPLPVPQSIRDDVCAWDIADARYVVQIKIGAGTLKVSFPDPSRGSSLESAQYNEVF